jgi:integrase
MLKNKQKFGGYTVHEYRPGQFQIYFTHNKKQIFLQKDSIGFPLVNMIQVKGVIADLRGNGYDPEYWGKDFKKWRFDLCTYSLLKHVNCCPEWLGKKKKRGMAEKYLIPYFKKTDIRSIKTKQIDEFFKHLKEEFGLKDGRIHSIFTELKGLLRFYKLQLPDFPKIQRQEPVIKWLTSDEQDKIFQFIPENDIKIFTFMRFFGTRIGEAAGLLKESVFLDHQPPYVAISTSLDSKKNLKGTKTRRTRILPIPEHLKWIFSGVGESKFVFEHVSDRYKGPYRVKHLWRIWKKANKKSGVRRVNLYNSMRHSFGCQRLNDGFSMAKIQAVMGHTNPKMTERYAQYTLDTLLPVLIGKHTKLIDSKISEPIENEGQKVDGSGCPPPPPPSLRGLGRRV